MAYTNSPQNQTYKTEVITFDDTATYRTGNLTVQRDSAIWNMFYDRVSQENKTRDVSLKKRPGLGATAYNLTKSSSADSLRGFFYDVPSNRFYWAVNDKVYSVTPDSGTAIRTVATLVTSSGYVGFCEFLQASTSKRFVVFSDGTDLWIDDYAATSCAKVVDADMPTPHVPSPVQLDGYIFLADANTNDMYNCVNDDPTSWEPGDYISAEMSGDYITKLANMRNYIVAFGNKSLEMFYDAANASGSPMKRVESGYKSMGYVTGLCKIADILYFVGQDENKNIGVYRLDGYKLDPISDEVVNRSLQVITSTQNDKGEVNLERDGYSLSIDGHTFYCLVTPQTTWVYDIEEKFWYEWKTTSNVKLDIQAAWGMFNGAQYVAIGGQTYVSQMSSALYQDFGSNFTCRYITQDNVFGTLNWKTCNRAMIQGDMHQHTGTSNLQLYYSDNDWADGGTNGPININLFNSSPFAQRLGRFRNRSFKLEYSDNYPLRLKKMELDLNIGSH